MTEPQTITTEHVRALLESQDATSIIGLIEGEIRVIEAAQRDDEANRGALEVISREELDERLGNDPDEGRLQAQAEALTTATQLLGG